MVIYCIDKGRKLYLRRMVFHHLPLWHVDPAMAWHLDEQRAKIVAEKLRQAVKKPAEIGVEDT
jgi:hypothetical protein